MFDRRFLVKLVEFFLLEVKSFLNVLQATTSASVSLLNRNNSKNGHSFTSLSKKFIENKKMDT